jgi:hypothetical protein
MTGVDEQAATIRSGLARALDISVVVIVGVWHIVYVVPSLALNAGTYRWLWVELLAWLLLTAILIRGSARLLAGRPVFAHWLTSAAVLVLAGAGAVSMVPGDQITGAANWAFGDVVLIGVLLMLRERLLAFGAVFLVNILLNLVVLLLTADQIDQSVVARFLVIAVAGGILVPSAVLIAARALDDAAAVAGVATAKRAESEAERQVADTLHEARRERYESLRDQVAPLLDGLADGSLDPGSAEVQRRCAIEAARLRRLFAESDDVPDPLLHEVRACASAAERRGVLVELATVGRLPELPLVARRILTEPAIQALASSTAWARVTVYGGPDEVVLSAVGDRTWLEARWEYQ